MIGSACNVHVEGIAACGVMPAASVIRFPVVACCLLSACSGHQGQFQASTASASGSVAGRLTEPDLTKLQQDPGQWAMTAGNYASTRFSTLEDINTTNVSRSKWPGRSRPGWSRPRSGAAGRRDTMYFVTPFPEHSVRARPDETRAPMKWKYEPEPLRGAGGGVLRLWSIAAPPIAERRIYLQHARRATIAVDAADRSRRSGNAARRHQPRRDHHDGAARGERTRCWSATAAVNSACAAGSRRSMRRPARSPGAPTAPAPTRTC